MKSRRFSYTDAYKRIGLTPRAARRLSATIARIGVRDARRVAAGGAT